MICIDNTHTDAYFNLAAEEYLLNNFTTDVFMLWQNESSVIIGKHQNIQAEVNLEFANENRIKVVRRHSGGGAVYHDAGNLNLTFIETGNNSGVGKYTKRMLDILESIGIRAQEDERHSFYIDGLKISGSAQFIRKNKLLFHATLLFSSDLKQLTSTLDSIYSVPENGAEAPKKHFVKSVKSPVTNISEHLTEPMQLSEFKRMILNDFLSNSGSSLYAFSQDDLAAITKLKQEKYATNGWNYNA